MNWDIEKFNGGSDEIERKREIITKTIGWIVSQIERTASDLPMFKKKWAVGTAIVDVDIPDIGNFQLQASDKNDFRVQRLRASYPDGFFFSGKLSIPYTSIDAMYEGLPLILEAANDAVSEAKIREKFDFFCERCPK